MRNELKQIWKEAWAEYRPLEDIKDIWARAKAEVQAEQHQKAITKLAKQAERTIAQLKKNPYLQ